jgi:Tol biopolymer transport system component
MPPQFQVRVLAGCSGGPVGKRRLPPTEPRGSRSRADPLPLAAAFILGTLLILVAGKSDARAAPVAFEGAIVFERDPGASSDIYVTTAPRKASRLVATPAQEFDPALFRDGRVAFARAKGKRSEIYVLDSGIVTRLTSDRAVDQHASWSPSGDRIAYSRDYGKGADIVEMRVGDPSSAMTIAPAAGDDFTPSYSPDNRIAFASNRSGNFDLYVVNANRRKVTRLTRDHEMELSPRWSPDGKRIVFTRVDKSGSADIWMLTLTPRALTRLTRNPADDSDPSFSPDGRQIAFVSDRASGVPAIWTMVLKPGARARLVSPPTAVNQGPVWGPKAPPAKAVVPRAPARTAVSITCPDYGTHYGGTDGPNTIDGTGADDTICGRGGDDTIRGWGGHDTLSGGKGKDVVKGGDHNDPIVSGGLVSGDHIYGGNGDDKLYALDLVRDHLYGGDGFDRCQYDAVDERYCNGTIA